MRIKQTDRELVVTWNRNQLSIRHFDIELSNVCSPQPVKHRRMQPVQRRRSLRDRDLNNHF